MSDGTFVTLISLGSWFRLATHGRAYWPPSLGCSPQVTHDSYCYRYAPGEDLPGSPHRDGDWCTSLRTEMRSLCVSGNSSTSRQPKLGTLIRNYGDALRSRVIPVKSCCFLSLERSAWRSWRCWTSPCPNDIGLCGRLARGAVASVHVGAIPSAGSGYRMETHGCDGTLVLLQSDFDSLN